MQSKHEKQIALLTEILAKDDAPVAEIRAAAQALVTLVVRQNRQLDKLTRLSDASEAKLNDLNSKLAYLTENLARFVPQTVVDLLMQAGNDQLIQKERRELTVFFSDIVGFTAMTERLEPEQLATLMGDYFTEMNNVCDHWGGTLDQFIGDAIVIFFGAPETEGADEDASDALGMAIEMQARLRALRVKWADQGLRPPLHVRMGLSTGYTTVGNFGSERRMHYTAIGNTVNEAARIQELCPPDSILIGADTQLRVRDKFTCEPRDSVQLKGRQNPVQLYEINVGNHSVGNDLIVGTADGFRIYMDKSVISDKQAARDLLQAALRQLDNPQAGGYSGDHPGDQIGDKVVNLAAKKSDEGSHDTA